MQNRLDPTIVITMKTPVIHAQAPANIALIKYMGKKDSALNVPANPSVSFTLKSLLSQFEVSVRPHAHTTAFQWIPEIPQWKNTPSTLFVPALNPTEIHRILQHCQTVHRLVPEIFARFGLAIDPIKWKSSHFQLKSGNTFPAASGIASSASSFAALTLALVVSLVKEVLAFEQCWHQNQLLKRELAQLSQLGSGSACRSWEGPWVLWDPRRGAHKIKGTASMPLMVHFVVLIRSTPKHVPSSIAHERVKTSPLWKGRASRVKQRIQLFQAALRRASLDVLSQISWTEAWEMHSLFHTCQEPFTYWEPGTLLGLQTLSIQRKDAIQPALITLDAGPNLHVLVEKTQQSHWRKILKDVFLNTPILEDEQGEGATFDVDCC